MCYTVVLSGFLRGAPQQIAWRSRVIELRIIGLCQVCSLFVVWKMRALFMPLLALRDTWNIHEEEFFKFSGLDWLLILLDQLNLRQLEQILFIFWRAWHLRNDLIFGKGKVSATVSVNYVQNYWSAFSLCQG